MVDHVKEFASSILLKYRLYRGVAARELPCIPLLCTVHTLNAHKYGC